MNILKTFTIIIAMAIGSEAAEWRLIQPSDVENLQTYPTIASWGESFSITNGTTGHIYLMTTKYGDLTPEFVNRNLAMVLSALTNGNPMEVYVTDETLNSRNLISSVRIKYQ